MSKMNTILGLLLPLMLAPLAREKCEVQVEKVDCTWQENTHLLYTCQSNLGNKECFCDFENPFLSELGWFKTCKTKHPSKLRKKKVRKRQVVDPDICGAIQPPIPGKASCRVSPTEIRCEGFCDESHEFIDGRKKHTHICRYSEGVWKPSPFFPACKPRCDPACQNGGNCTAANLCSCPNDFRGSQCQYPISLCGFLKNMFASTWNCNHTGYETTCDISCHAPGSTEAEVDMERYVCSLDGQWSLALPPCVRVVQCPEPKKLENGGWSILPRHAFIAGSTVSYFCEEGFLLQGEQRVTCYTNGTWSNVSPVCVPKESVLPSCSNPGEVTFGKRRILKQHPQGFPAGSSVSYECNENYTMLGVATIVCQSNGQWSSRTPQCVTRRNIPAHCSKPNAPKNAAVQVTFPEKHPLRTFLNTNIPLLERLYMLQGNERDFSSLPEETFLVGSRVQYRCKSRFYRLYGSEYQTCMSSLTWSGYQPACVPECGKSDSPRTPFIVNGNSSPIGQWPWMVGLALKGSKGPQIICGGSLISELWVLTAAHCVTKKLSNIRLDPNDLLIFCGKYYRSLGNEDEHVQIRRVKQILVHEDYDFIHYDVDIALLQLENPVELAERVRPICLPTQDTTRENIRDGQKGIVLGWGLTENGTFSETLRETILPVVGHDRCEEAYREGLRTVTITQNMFCAGYDSGRSDTCNGDSGGPFMFAIGPNNDNRWYLEGLVSWGSESGCGTAHRYSGFTKVGRFVPWIRMFI